MLRFRRGGASHFEWISTTGYSLIGELRYLGIDQTFFFHLDYYHIRLWMPLRGGVELG